ncbi:hypothetical protein M011DRAFT_406582 [Sporormia fimetaria CBS 119925]|uniref:DUF8032 domain-containing protein n=1 Tax=Sporormia fimetaria CBS 119925 TaxID=1340428 RepID=A0A6A6V746_9PLEO|nr:hypothetical protein M011DRAFT_406582 [Sporormia fimetaria CBS 119925]
MHPGAPVPGGAANMNPNAAPGPIPATTPLVVRQDNNGVQWIAFEYSRDRVKMEYTIRCDVESVNVDSLSDSFKTDNCVYPRACCPKDQYKGNRLAYETECNTVGWALAELNPCLRGKRGLIQRAVDSWRNSNQDPRLRSRRVRRQAKLTARKAQQGHPSPMAGPGAPPGVPHAAAMASAPRPPNMGMGAPPMHHPHDHHGAHPGNEDVSVDAYSNATHHHQPPPAPKPSVNGEHRPAHNVYPDFPTNHTQPQVNGMPHINNPSAPLPGAPPSQAEARAARLAQDEQDRRSHLFGALAPDVLKRRFIVVKDEQKNNQNSRIHCSLGEVQLQEIPDSFRKVNCLYPRSYFDMQMSSPPQSPTGSGHFQNDEPDRPNKPQCPLGGQTLVRVSTPERPVEVPVPRLTKAARTREIDINELGYRMTWAQSRMFSHRQLFLQRSMDHYRNMMESQTAKKEGHDVPPHFQTRRGKKWWPQRRSRNRRGSD